MYKSLIFSTIILLGAAVRIAVYAQNHSLFLDEANLASNIAEKSWGQFFQTLDYDQFAPPFFMVVQHLFSKLLGNTEYTLRLFPLLCGLTSLLVFYFLLKRFVSEPWVLWYPLWTFAFSGLFIRYSVECKQYCPDLLLGISLTLFAIKQSVNDPFSGKNTAIWALAGASGIWFSMPIVFVLAGIGVYWLSFYPKEKDFRVIKHTLICGVVWLGSFAVFYQKLLQESISNVPLKSSHSPFFLPLLPLNIDDWVKWFSLWRIVPYNIAGHTALAIGIGALGMLLGMYFLWKERQKEGLLLVVPILACYLASGMGQYSLMTRLLVWLFPLAMVLNAVGWQGVFRQLGNKNLRWGIVLLLLVSAGLFDGYRFFGKKFEIEEIRPVLEQLSTQYQSGDLILIDHEAMPAFYFYQKHHNERHKFAFDQAISVDIKGDKPDLNFIRKNAPSAQRVWLVYSHVVSDITRNRMNEHLMVLKNEAVLSKEIAETGAFGYLFLLNGTM